MAIASIKPVPSPVVLNKPATLDQAIAAWDATSLPDYGKDVGLQQVAKMSLQAAVSQVVDTTFDDRAAFEASFAIMHGAKAVKSLQASLREIGKQTAQDADTPAAGAQLENAYVSVANALSDAFSGFAQVSLVEHMISEDGDVEQRLLAGQKKDGSWTILQYSDNPY